MGRILVTGIGVVSAIGNNAAQNRSSLLRAVAALQNLKASPSRFAGIMPFGEIKISNGELTEKFNQYKEGITRPCLLSLMAMEEAIADAGLNPKQLSDPSTALINATTVGGMCLTDELFSDANAIQGGSVYLSSYDCADTALFLQKHYRIGGIINSINTACSSSANSIAFGAALIKNGRAKKVIAGGVDCLAKFTINGFNSLHILSNELCRPFDINRKGLNLGEAAAYLVLEPEEELNGRKVYAELTGYANANDAFHPSSLSAEGLGPYTSMINALKNADLSAAQIDYINAHGTGTENNDAVESVAMQKVFSVLPAFSSTKGNTGHTLGAAGALEAAYCIMNLQYQELYPALQFETPIPESGLVPNLGYQSKSIKHVMSNSFWIWRNCTTLIFSHS